VCKAKFDLVTFLADLKDDVGTRPFGLIFNKTNAAVRGMPYNFPAWYKFNDLMDAAMNVLSTELKLGAEFVSVARNLL
jgi:hypothetical protein